MNPIKKHPWFSIIFLLVIVAELVGISGNPQIRLASKGMIMGTLLTIYIMSAKRQDQLFLTGMIFALLGDAFLLFTTDTFFMIGLGCFLIMQICYAAVFWKKRRIPRSKDKLVSVVLAALPLIFLSMVWSHLGGLKVGVVLYSIAITIMLVTAFLRHGMLSGYGMVLIGSILFVISDLSLAVERFVTQAPALPYIVILTYIAAQYLITMGLLADEEPRAKPEVKVEGNFGRHKI